MYTFTITISALVAIFGGLAAVVTAIFDKYVQFDDEDEDIADFGIE